MTESYVTLTDAFAEIVILRSRFLAYVYHCESEEECTERLAALRKKHYDATHVCYAYCVDIEGRTVRFSDDGEPSSTAGAPILSVINKGGLRQVLIAVVRYFGGTKLGAGGLVRAYTEAATAGVSNAKEINMRLCSVWAAETDYNMYARINAAVPRMGGKIVTISYGETVAFEAVFPAGTDRTEALTDLTGGKTEFIKRGDRYEIYQTYTA